MLARANLGRLQAGQLVPGHAGGKLDPHSRLDRLAARHGHALVRLVGQVVALGEKVLLLLGEIRLGGAHLFHDGREVSWGLLAASRGEPNADGSEGREGDEKAASGHGGFLLA